MARFIEKCPYCKGKVLLGKNQYGYVYVCEHYPECDSYVGTHKKSKKPLGRLANKELRVLKQECHIHFDWLWRQSSEKNARRQAYNWLSQKLDIDLQDCHIGYFNKELCLRTIKICKKAKMIIDRREKNDLL